MSLGMSASLSFGFRQEQRLTQSLSLSQSLGETSGDIPVYSLHKIVRLLERNPLDISAELRAMLDRALVTANRTYRRESGNAWNCLTSSNLVAAIESVNSEVGRLNALATSNLPAAYASRAAAISALLAKKRSECIALMKGWFEANYNDLLYDMSGKIPWAVVQKLRRSLGLWVVGATSPFVQDIGEMILEVAREKHVSADNPEDAWEALGGTLFTEKR